MIKQKFETVRSFLLLALILLSIFQAGILLVYQNSGYPAGFMSAIFPGRSNQYSFDMNEAKDVIRKPAVVAASEGKYGPRWIIDRETPWHEELCREFSYYLAKVLSGASRNEESRQYSAQEWYNCAVSKKAFLFSYVKNVDMELFTWLFGIQGQGGGTGFTGIFKAALLYEESPNDNEMVVCITDGVIIQKHIIRTGNLDRKELSGFLRRSRRPYGINQKEAQRAQQTDPPLTSGSDHHSFHRLLLSPLPSGTESPD